MGANSSTLGRWLSPDPLAGDISNPQSLNRYAYALNNPTTLTDPLGLTPQDVNPCAYAPTRPACGGDAVRHVPAGSLFQDPFSLIGIPVVTDTFTPPGFISGSTPSVYDGYAVSYALYSPGGWTTVQVGDAFSLFGGSLAQPSSFSSWGTFAKSFVQNFSLKSARQPGESFFGCVDRTQQGLLGSSGAAVLNAVTGFGLVSSALSRSFGGGLASAGAVPGTNEIRTRIGTSLADVIARGGVEAGTLSAETAATISAASAAASKIVIPITVATSVLEGGFLGACR